MEKDSVKMGTGMMQDMMQNMMKGAGGMPEMCMKMMQQMAGGAVEDANSSAFASPEMRGLFEEWERSLEEELMKLVKESGKTTPSDVASKLKISKETVLLLVGKLAREGKLIIDDIRVVE